MSRNEQNQQKSTFFTNHPGRIWLLGGIVVVLLLATTAVLLAPRLLTSSSIKQKIQAVVLQKTGGELDYRAIDLCYLPHLGLELQGVSLVFPEQLQGRIAYLRILPKLLPLLRGNVQLSALRLDTPELTVELPANKADVPAAQPLTLSVLQEKIKSARMTVGPMLSGLKAVINDGQLVLKLGKDDRISIAELDLQVDISATNPGAAQTKLFLSIGELNILHHQQQQTITDISLHTSAEMSGDTVHAKLDQLSLGQPHVALSGELSCNRTKPNCTLELTGQDIDIAAVRKTALALAGGATPSKEIFNYLRSGRVAQISFFSQAEQFSGLGQFANILINGQLQDGSVAVPQIKLELSELTGDVRIDKGVLQGSKLSARLKNSTVKDASLQLGLTKDSDVFQLELALHAELAEIYPWLASLDGLQDPLQKITAVSGQMDLAELKLQGALHKPSAWNITSSGTLQKLAIKTELFPDTIDIADGAFTMDGGQLSFTKLKAASQDTALTLSGSVKGFPQQLQRLDLGLDGHMGKQSFTWLATQLRLPESYTIQAPFTISDGKISWQADSHSSASFSGSVSLDKGPVINAGVTYSKDRLQIHQLRIKDQYSDATIVYDLVGAQREGTFSGKLQHETLQALFVDTPLAGGQLEGDLAFSLPSTKQTAVNIKGQLTGDKLPIVLASGDQADIDHITLQGNGPELKVDITGLTWEKLTWAPVKGAVFFTPDSTEIKIIEAGLCGIDSPGTITTTGDKVSVTLSLTGQGLNVVDSYTCLTNGEVKMTGKLDFSSRIKATGQADRLAKGIEGPLHMTFSNGVIEQDKMITRILEVLNVTEIIKNRLPNLATKGLAYNSMTIDGRFHNGLLSIDKYHMDGETLNLVGEGEINLLKRTIDMQLFASPLQTIDSIVKKIPGINYLLDGSLVSIPISISGELTNPKVRVLSVSAVSSSLFNLAKRTIKSPFKLLDALNPWSEKK